MLLCKALIKAEDSTCITTQRMTLFYCSLFFLFFFLFYGISKLWHSPKQGEHAYSHRNPRIFLIFVFDFDYDCCCCF